MIKAIQEGVAYLGRVQEADGGFRGLMSADKADFSEAHPQPTSFFSILILGCLGGVSGAEGVCGQAAAFLLRHKGESWSWNYWVKGETQSGLPHYPDDLDDTTCALAALWHYDIKLIDGEVQARLARHLIATEVQPGGPYRTWLVGAAAPSIWQDVDIAVNANIGYLLALLGVKLPGLERYVTTALERDELSSAYYMGTIPALYFLARWYQGPARQRLRTLIIVQLKRPKDSHTSLAQAMLLTAALRMGVVAKRLRGVAEELILARQTDGSWPPAALYYEPPVGGTVQYAGSAALTTAFCVEALTRYTEALAAGPTSRPVLRHAAVLRQALGRSHSIAHGDLRRLFRAQVRRLAARDHDHQITGMATSVARACQQEVAADTLQQLNVGSLNGWVAYTIYDDFLDGEGRPPLLGAANVALRQTLQSFRAALPQDELFQGLVETALDRVDGANTWEVVHARARVRRGVVRIQQLPDYGDYGQLAERSWGHTLAASGVLRAGGYLGDSREVAALERFFYHFLIARQLNDDAHDWEDDLSRGHLTAVVALLLRPERARPIKLSLPAERDRLRVRFWEETITEVAQLVERHATAARAALASCTALRHTEQLEQWLAALERSAHAALEGRTEARKFIAAYRAPT